MVVVGAGIVGCSVSYHLAKNGLKVALVDKGGVAGEASQAAAGVQAGDGGSKGRHRQARIRSAPAARPAPPDPRRLAGAGA